MYNQLNRPAGIGRRLLGALIDIVFVVLFTTLINTYIATPIANDNFELEIKETICADLQEQYYTIAQDEYKIGEYTREDNNIEFKYNEEFEKLSEDEQQKIVDKFNEDPRVVVISDTLKPIINDLNSMYFVMVAASLVIPEFIFFLLIPLFLKRSATLGQLAMKLGTVHKDDYEAKPFQLVLRFLVILLIETLLIYYCFPQMILIFVPLFSLIVMALNRNKNCLHDILASTKVVRNDALIFNDYNEKSSYLARRDQPIVKQFDNDTQELRDNFQFIDEQEERLKNIEE